MFFANVCRPERVQLTEDAIAIDNEILFDFHLLGNVISTPTQLVVESLAVEYSSTKKDRIRVPLILQNSIIHNSADAVCAAFGAKYHGYFDYRDLASSDDYSLVAIPARNPVKPIEFDFIKTASLSRITKITCSK